MAHCMNMRTTVGCTRPEARMVGQAPSARMTGPIVQKSFQPAALRPASRSAALLSVAPKASVSPAAVSAEAPTAVTKELVRRAVNMLASHHQHVEV